MRVFATAPGAGGRAPADAAAQPGRICPADYRTHPADFARLPEIKAETLYVIGGLYGNAFALDAIEALAAAEPGPVSLVFNGDAHWFDAEHDAFARLDARLAAYPAITGNVEFEAVRDIDIGAGCGCAYPPGVSDGVVTRSNSILARLKDAIARSAPLRDRLRALPMTLLAEVGGLRVGIVHGDAQSLAGWGFATDALDDPAAGPWLDALRRESTVDVFASTHTCGAVMRDLALPSGRLIVANNGAAGMGNFEHDARGLITRISTRPSPHPALYGLRCGALEIDALPVAFDLAAFTAFFDALWPSGSPAEVSYRARILGTSGGVALRSAMPK